MNPNHGMQSRETGDGHMREIWARCDKLNAKRKQPGRYAPWAAVVVKPELLPRLPDPEVVDRYAANFDALPPIKVQADTLVLIGGMHRLRAAPKALRDYILIEEVECADADLAWEAFEDNRTNAAPYRTSERVALIKLVLERHPDWSNTLVGNYLGLDPDTVSKHRRRDHVTETRLGADGKTYPVRQVTENRVPDAEDRPAERAINTQTAEGSGHRNSVTSAARPDSPTRVPPRSTVKTFDPEPDYEDWPDDDASQDAVEKFEEMAFKDHEYEDATLEVDPDSEIPGTIEEAPFGILAINDDAEGRIVDGDGEPSAVTQGEVEQLPLVAPSPADEWFEAHRKPGHAWLTGLSDAALTYISALETAALTSDEVVAEVEAHPEARREARWHRATIAEQGKVFA